MVDKRELGVGYLFGAGIALILSLVGYILLSSHSLLVALGSSVIAIILSISLPYVGYWLHRSAFPDAFIWRIAQWSAVGLGISTILTILVIGVRIYTPDTTLLPSLVVNSIAGGSVLGVMVGTTSELRERYHIERNLNQRNKVMNRVLRHNIRNSMNTILGYATHIAEEERGITTEEAIEVIKRNAHSVISLSQAARNIDNLGSTASEEPIELVPAVREYLDGAESLYPEVEFSCELPEASQAVVDPIFSAVLSNLVENAVKHNDSDPHVEVRVDADEPREGWMRIQVADNGPGIPDIELDVLKEGDETPVRHGNGLGLWLVKWFVEYYDGELRFEANQPRGTRVTMVLPATYDVKSDSVVELESAVTIESGSGSMNPQTAARQD